MPKRVVKVVAGTVIVAVFALAGVVGGWVLYNRSATGTWRMPTGNDLVRIKHRFVPGSYKPPRTVYLHRGPITLTAGEDDARKNVSSVLRGGANEEVELRGFRGSNAAWKRIVACVRETYRPFDITFVEERPKAGDYFLAVVGGKPNAIGYKGHHVGGLAPFNGSVIPHAVVFVFSDALRNRTRAVCNTIAMEVAHAYGLDHAYDCSDVMTYLPDCGPKYFRDKEVPCGEHEARLCADGKKTQNSHRLLAKHLGRKPASRPTSR